MYTKHEGSFAKQVSQYEWTEKQFAAESDEFQG